MEFYSAGKKSETLKATIKWMDLKVTQAQACSRSYKHILALMCTYVYICECTIEKKETKKGGKEMLRTEKRTKRPGHGKAMMGMCRAQS